MKSNRPSPLLRRSAHRLLPGLAGLAWLAGLAAAGAEIAATADGAAFPPREHGMSRYENLREKSPFEFKLEAPPPPVAPNPFEGMVLAGYVGSSKNLTVYLVNTKANGERLSVYSDASPRKKQDKSGIRIVSLNRGRTLKTTTVTLEKDGQTGEVSFDDKALSNMKGGAAGGAQPGQVPGQPGQRPPGFPGMMRPPGAPVPGQAAPQQPYQAPQAFVPGQNPAAGGVQPGGAVQGQAQVVNGTVMVNGQPVSFGGNTGQINALTSPTTNTAGLNALQNVQPQAVPQINVQPQVQPMPQPTPQPGGGPPQAPPRRRVVLPSGT